MENLDATNFTAQQAVEMISTLRNELRHQSARMEAMNVELQHLRSNNTPHTTTLSPSDPSSDQALQGLSLFKSFKEVYNLEKGQFETFFLGLVGVLESSAAGTPKNRFFWIYGRFGPKCKPTLAAYAQEYLEKPTYSEAAFLNYLENTYANKQLRQQAIFDLRSLQQRPNQPFLSFYPVFERTLTTAGGSSFPDQVKKDYLYNSLSKELQRLLVTVELPANWEGYVQKVQEKATLFESLKRQNSHTSFPSSFPPSPSSLPPSQGYGEPMDLSNVFTFSKELQEENKKLKGKRAVWVSKEVLEERKKNRLCFRCGRKGCTARACPLLPARSPTSQPFSQPYTLKRQKKPVQVQFVEPEEEEDLSPSDSDSESGKD